MRLRHESRGAEHSARPELAESPPLEDRRVSRAEREGCPGPTPGITQRSLDGAEACLGESQVHTSSPCHLESLHVIPRLREGSRIYPFTHLSTLSYPSLENCPTPPPTPQHSVSTAPEAEPLPPQYPPRRYATPAPHGPWLEYTLAPTELASAASPPSPTPQASQTPSTYGSSPPQTPGNLRPTPRYPPPHTSPDTSPRLSSTPSAQGIGVRIPHPSPQISCVREAYPPALDQHPEPVHPSHGSKANPMNNARTLPVQRLNVLPSPVPLVP